MVVWLLALLAAVGIAGGTAVLFGRYRSEREELQRVRELFSRYVPSHVVDDILRRRNLALLWAQRHYATVLCCRIKNFGFFAEELGAEETLRHLNEFYAVAGRAIVRHGGVIERLHADGVTAVFGVLTTDVFQEDRALRAALRIARLAKAMDVRWQAQGRKPFEVAIGVNSGNVVAGEVGFAQRREFAIVGNPATVASHLQQAAEQLNAAILASAATFEAVADTFVAVPVSTIPLAGLKRLQKAYIVRGVANREREELLHLPAQISALETVIQAEPAPPEVPPAAAAVSPPLAQRTPRGPRPSFAGFDDTASAMPDPPIVSGTYEAPGGETNPSWPPRRPPM